MYLCIYYIASRSWYSTNKILTNASKIPCSQLHGWQFCPEMSPTSLIYFSTLLQERLRKLGVSIFKKSHFMNILQSHFSNRWSHFGILVLKTLNRTCYSRVLLWLKLLEHRDWQIRTLPTLLILKYFVEMSDRDIWIMNLWRICMHILDWIRIEVCNTSTFYLCRYIFMYGW